MTIRTDFPSFVCDACGESNLVIEGPFTDTSAVRCAGCGEPMGPFDVFVDELKTRLRLKGYLQDSASRSTPRPQLWRRPR